MADYLGKLVAKNMGTAEVILPRRSTRFETAQTKESYEISSVEEPFERISEVQVVNRPITVQSNRANDISESDIPPDLPIKQNSDKQISNALGVPATTIQVSEQLNLQDETSTPKDKHPEPESKSNKPETYSKPPELERLPKRLSKKIDDSEVNVDLSPVKVVQSVQLNPNQHTDSNSDQEPKLEPKSRNESITQIEVRNQTIEKHSEIIVRPRVEPVKEQVSERINDQTLIRFPQNHERFSELVEPVEAPTINVSIGRVEIRAITTQTIPKETRNKPQTLSLDEYLQKRRAGGDR